MKILKRKLVIVVVLIISLTFSGCGIDEIEYKFGIKNKDFEYLKYGDINQIEIKSTRDPGFNFVIKDKSAISEIYSILSAAKSVKTKSDLDPDYILQIQKTSDKAYTFKYIVGIDKSNAGNLYGNNKSYVVSSRLDNDIIKSFWNVNVPDKFNYVYYKSIEKVLDHVDSGDIRKKKIGIQINDDVNVLKFILSADLENFKGDLKDKYSNVQLYNDKGNYDYVLNVSTEGYTSNNFKCTISFNSKDDNTDKEYYVLDKCKDDNWDIEAYTKKPNGF